MKFIKIVLFSALFIGTLFAQNLKEGDDYIVLSDPIKNMDNSVIELFNVGCPHCAYFNDKIPTLLEFLPDNVSFYPYHLSTGAKFHNEFSDLVAVSLIKDAKDGLNTKSKSSNFKKLVDFYFKTIHKDKKGWASENDFVNDGVNVLNISKDEYNKILKEKDTQNLLKNWNSAMKYAELQGVPSFIVNGKYMIVTRNISSIEDLIFKIDYLLSK